MNMDNFLDVTMREKYNDFDELASCVGDVIDKVHITGLRDGFIAGLSCGALLIGGTVLFIYKKTHKKQEEES